MNYISITVNKSKGQANVRKLLITVETKSEFATPLPGFPGNPLHPHSPCLCAQSPTELSFSVLYFALSQYPLFPSVPLFWGLLAYLVVEPSKYSLI